MRDKLIHIVSFDVPFPPDYGGVIDVYYRAKALKENGLYVILHCFEYGRGTNHDFSEIAHEVYYYQRSLSFWKQISFSPFIVNTRKNELLKKRLLEDNLPILLEGIHCTSILKDERFSNREIHVRMHNIEHHYYKQLGKSEKYGFKKLYFLIESIKLKFYEKNLKKAKTLLCITNSDLNYYQKINENTHIWELGIKLPKVFNNEKIQFQALFHGNLSVPENNNVAIKLINFWRLYNINIRLIIAGKNPSLKLKQKIIQNKKIQLVENPSDNELDYLLNVSQFSLLISFQKSGMKIKLLHALLKGNICIATKEMLYSTDLDQFTSQINSLKDMLKLLTTKERISQKDLQNRKKIILLRFDIHKNAQKIIPLLFSVKKR